MTKQADSTNLQNNVEYALNQTNIWISLGV